MPDEFVEQFAWAGTAEQVAAQVARVVEMGVTNLTILPSPSGDVMPTIRAFAEEAIPRILKPGMAV